jgi:gliding motility-associated transport system ATP-binding protein
MIEVDSLSRSYGKHIAVDNVSFSITDNEIVGLLGHNGAGKTTIMKMLSGYLEPSAGRVKLDGVPVSDGARELQQLLGYLPENLPVYPEMMVADYLDYAAATKGIARPDRMRAVREAIIATDLHDRALSPIHTLSRGLKQRVGVAQAILGRPRLIILDEPTNGLDVNHTLHMRRLIKQLARRATVILSTHIMQEVEAVCDRVLLLRNGRLVVDQALATLRESRQLVVHTCGSQPALGAYLKRLPQVAALHSDEALTTFTLTLHNQADIDTAASNVAQTVVKAGAQLYRLYRETVDLDSMFREDPAPHGQPSEDADLGRA